MAGLLEKVEKSKLDRRTFVAAAAVTGVAASLGLTGCDNKVAGTDSVDGSPATAALTNGEWKTFSCAQDGCTRACVNQAYVVDGVILRQRTDETIEDSVDNPQQRSCIRGRAQRRDVTSADRLKYPMKRKSWQPGGGENIHGDLRGVDEWERISWDDAIKYIADEFTRIRDTYGNASLLATGQDERKMNNAKIGSGIFNMMGGCLTTFGQQSQGGPPVPSKKMMGHWDNGITDGADRMALRHTKLMILWGYNSAWAQGTGDMYNLLNAKKESGMKVILIDPWFTPSAQPLADQWIPIHPSTDGALVEALCYELINNGWHDQDFLDRCTVGFDANHMPADAKTTENFRDHIMGVYDGQPKTPEWASPITGVPVETIRTLAQEMGTTKPMALRASIGVGRTYYGNRFAQLFFTLGWVAGSIGVLGADTAIMQGGLGDKLDGPVARGNSKFKYPVNPICTEPRGNGELTGGEFDPSHEYGIAFSEWHKAIVDDEYTLPGPANEKRACNIKAVYCENARNSSNAQTGNQYVEEAYRKVEFVVYQDLYMKTGPMYADIVLPVKSMLELEFAYAARAYSEAALVGTNVIPGYFECKDDIEIFYLLCDALGFGEDVVPRTTAKQNMFEMLASTNVVMENGTDYEPLVSVTQEDLDLYGLTGDLQEGRVPLQEFMETGIYRFERQPNDNHMNAYLSEYRADPEGNPLPTTSGKLEIYCQALKDYYDQCQLHDIDVIPKYKAAVDGYEQIPQNPDYKYQLITPHHIRQCHSCSGNNKTLNEVFPNDFIMNIEDARAEGLDTGDWVLVSGLNAGQIARRVQVMANVCPGVVLLGEGNWVDIDQETGVDVGGNANIVTRCQLLGDGYQAYNTTLLKVEPYTGTELLPDYKRPLRVPIAE